MALIGNCTYYKYEDSGTTEEQERILPDGTVEKYNQPIYNQIETSYENIYVRVTNIAVRHTYINLPDGATHKESVAFIEYGGWESAEESHRVSSLEPLQPDWEDNFLFRSSTQIVDFDYDANIFKQAYDTIKSIEGMGNLVND